MSDLNFPSVLDPDKVGDYPGYVFSGGGYVWDAVLEYRVWCHPHDGAPAEDEEGSDYFYAFDNYEDALAYSQENAGCEEPLALVLQKEYIDEPEAGTFVHIKEERITEWPVEFLRRPRRTASTIPNFMAQDAPANRLDILRGLA